MYYLFSGIGRLLVKIFVIVMKILGITVGLTILGYCLGVLFEMQTAFAIILNNGFYFLGVDLQYNFTEVFTAIGFLVGFISSAILTIFNLIFTTRPAPVAAKTQMEYEKPTSETDGLDISEIALLVSTVDNSLETKLYSKGINTVAELANAKPESICDIVGSPELARLLIADAQKTLNKLFREPPQ